MKEQMNIYGPEILLLWPQKLIYFSIPKAACTAISAALNRLWQDHYGIARNVERPPRICRRLAWELRDTCRRFAFVRNPFDRLLSAWSNKVLPFRGKRDTCPDFGNLSPDTDFPSFVGHVCATPAEKSNQHVTPMTRLLYAGDTPLVDFVGRFESLAEDWQRLQQETGIALGELGKENASQHPPYREVFTPELRESVAEYYAADLKNFNYTF